MPILGWSIVVESGVSLLKTSANLTNEHVLDSERIRVMKALRLDPVNSLSSTLALPMIAIRYEKVEKRPGQFT
jgi:hypothetical protein